MSKAAFLSINIHYTNVYLNLFLFINYILFAANYIVMVFLIYLFINVVCGALRLPQSTGIQGITLNFGRIRALSDWSSQQMTLQI